MDAISYTDAYENLTSTMEKVCREHMPVMITRGEDEPVVMLSLEDFESFEEREFLRQNPATAQRLLEAISALESVKGGAKQS